MGSKKGVAAAVKQVKIVEVGPRDGLQNEAKIVSTSDKIAFINLLSETGLQTIEVSSCVPPKWIPQHADCKQVFNQIVKRESVGYPLLVPNVYGLENALDYGAKDISILASASENFAQKNSNCSSSEALVRCSKIMEIVAGTDVSARGYISCSLGCPYEGHIPVHQVVVVAKKLYEIGCAEIVLSDTIGVGTPLKVQELICEVCREVPVERLSVHFHDTYGMAKENILVALQLGVTIVDSSVSGLGGCPYAKGAAGNVASEEVVYMLEGMGIDTGVDIKKLLQAGEFIAKCLLT